MKREKLNENFLTLGEDHVYQIFLKELKTDIDVNDDNDNKSDNSDDSVFIPDNISDDNIDMNNENPYDMLCDGNNENEKSTMKEIVDDKKKISVMNKRYIDLLIYININIFCIYITLIIESYFSKYTYILTH